MVGEHLEDGLTDRVGVLGQQLLGGRDTAGRIHQHRRIGQFVVESAGLLDGEGRTRGGGAQDLDDLQGGRTLQRADLDEPVLADAVVQIDDGRAVAADGQAVAVEVVTDHIHPAGGATGDEEDLDARLLGGRERSDRTLRDGFVVAQQRAVQVGRDEPGDGRGGVLGGEGLGS